MKLKSELTEELQRIMDLESSIYPKASMLREALDRHGEKRLRVHIENNEIVFYRLVRVEVVS